jgi:hypothetical protein
MKLKLLDQIHISWIRPDTLRPGDEISVTPEDGEALLRVHPDKFSQIPSSDPIREDGAGPDTLAAMGLGPVVKPARKGKSK